RVRRFFQLVRYFEKELGAPWPDLLDRLAGGGIAVGVKFEADPSPALLVIQGTDEKLMQKFAKLGFELVEQELARQEAKERPTKGSYQGMETMRLSKDVHAALAGTALLIANSEKALQHGLDLYAGRDKKSMAERAGVSESAGLLPKETLASLW